ncbi:hypothetical protein [Aquimarina aggregata]|uniref:hypothetical protein n=1 Tax=Aquimarina aggregata TaxID=1642818 RepID=UPI00248FFD29|nr:hypothetical protein [Aquimarina aggregata]
MGGGDLSEYLSEIKRSHVVDEIKYTGTSTEILTVIENKSIITTLQWEEHHQETIDISKTNLLDFTVDVMGLKTLILNKKIKQLTFTGDLSAISDLKAEHPRKGAFLEIVLLSKTITKLPNFDLPELFSLQLQLFNIDIKEVCQYYPALKHISFWGYPGYLYNVKALKHLFSLSSIFIGDLFGYQPEDFPNPEELSSVTSIVMESIPKDVSIHIKKQFKHLYLDITKLRNEKWLEENLDNPFRMWDGRNGIPPTHFKKAFNAYKNLNSVIDSNPSPKELKVHFKAFIQVFNKLNSSKSPLETMEMDEMVVAYLELCKKAQLDTKEMQALLEKEMHL